MCCAGTDPSEGVGADKRDLPGLLAAFLVYEN